MNSVKNSIFHAKQRKATLKTPRLQQASYPQT